VITSFAGIGKIFRTPQESRAQERMIPAVNRSHDS
jgi:hypothetical protein